MAAMAPRMRTLQRADQALGLVGCAALQPLRWWRSWTRKDLPAARRILLVKLWGAGSLQLLTAAARVLRERHPAAELTLLTLENNAGFAGGFRAFDRIETLRVGDAGWWRLALRIGSLVARLRRARYDEVYDFEFFTRFSALISATSGAVRTHGFHSPSVWRGGFHDRTIPFNRYWHVAQNFAALAGASVEREVEAGDLAPFRVDRAETSSVEARLIEAGWSCARPLAVLNPNAGSLSLERRWPAPRFAELASRLARAGFTPVLVGNGEEHPYTRAIAEEARALSGAGASAILDLSGRLTPGELCALFPRAALVVSNDSGPMHLAAALGAPTLGLFGPETPVMYRPLGARARALWRPPICSPCINVHDNKRATCIHGRPECLMNLSVDEVEREALALVAAPMGRVPREHRGVPRRRIRESRR